MNTTSALDAQSLKTFRKNLRESSLAVREAMDTADRDARANRIVQRLAPVIDAIAPRILSFCWPFRGEVDVRAIVTDWLARDATHRACLPVVMAPRTPMSFRRWYPGCELREDTYAIPIPVNEEIVVPDCLILPLVAFDEAGYRLGYGAGYFDRTIEAIAKAGSVPVVIGIGYECVRVPTIHPQPYDAPLDWLITEDAVFRRDGATMRSVESG